MHKISGVYKICGPNDKVYIGSSKNIEKRIEVHRWELKNNKHKNKHLQAAWNKYGELAFTIEILEQCPVENLEKLEQFYIDYFWNLGVLYNKARFAYRGKKSIGQRLHQRFKYKARFNHKDTWDVLSAYADHGVRFQAPGRPGEYYTIDSDVLGPLFDFITNAYDYCNLYLDIDSITPCILEFFERADLNSASFIYFPSSEEEEEKELGSG